MADGNGDGSLTEVEASAAMAQITNQLGMPRRGAADQ
jgi:hypothetical protein